MFKIDISVNIAMPPRIRTYSPPTLRALALLGKQIRVARKQRRLSEADLAERIGIARSTLQLIETGNPRVEIGLVFEAAMIVGLSLFRPEGATMTAQNERLDDKLALLPRSIRRARKDVDDDF